MKKIFPDIIYLSIILLSFFVTTKKVSFFLLILFLLFLITKFIFNLITKNYNYTELPSYKKSSFYPLIFSLIIAIIAFFNYQSDLSLFKAFVMSLIYYLVTFLLLLPPHLKYYSKEKSVSDAFALSCTKTIFLPQISNSELSKFLRILHCAKINLIICSNSELSPKLTSSFQKVSYVDLDLAKGQNIILQESQLTTEQIQKLTANQDLYYVKDEDLATSISQIKKARGLIDNLIKATNLNTILTSALFLSIIFTSLLGYPMPLNYLLLLIIGFKKNIFFTCLAPYFRFDTDIMERSPRQENAPLYLKQDLIILVISSLLVTFAVTIPYMESLSAGGSTSLATTLALNTYLFCFLLLSLQNVTEKVTLLNLITIYQDRRMLLAIIMTIIAILALPYCPFIAIKSTIFSNYLRCFLVAFFLLITLDLTKLARFTTIRKKEK